MNECKIWLTLSDGSRMHVNALRVGRFAVHGAPPNHKLRDGLGDRKARAWLVTHINTGLFTSDFDDHADALAFADDISRFSARDPASRNPARAVQQIGPAVRDWAFTCRATGKYTPFPRRPVDAYPCAEVPSAHVVRP